MPLVLLAGNPNCGKTSLFNALTGSRQTVGNWPGVTVERKEGEVRRPGKATMRVVDLPGVYGLTPNSDDERVTAEVLSTEPFDLLVNVLDATTLERGLLFSLELAALGRPQILVLTMADNAERRNIRIDCEGLSAELGIPVVLVNSRSAASVTALPELLSQALTAGAIPRVPREIGQAGDELARADARFEAAQTLFGRFVTSPPERSSYTDKIDRYLLDKRLGLPLFFAIMGGVFTIALQLGGLIQDVFESVAGAVFVDGVAGLLEQIHSPAWVITLLSKGLGTGIQTVAGFTPVLFLLFLLLTFLEDCGYMTRAAFVTDRMMRRIGLPGKAFVPLLVGFGCTIPAILGTRTFDTRRDRLMTVFMAPFLSCGARLPVYVLFGAAVFGSWSGLVVFSFYLIGIAVAVLTGLLLKNTLLPGQPSALLMELPAYHAPLVGSLLRHAGNRLKDFLTRAGLAILGIVAVLSVVQNVSWSGHSLLDVAGRAIAPVLTPLGVRADLPEAGIALVTGIMAKEAVIGTLNSLLVISGLSFEQALTASFSPASAYAFLLFVLLYFPCAAAFTTALREVGARWAWLMGFYATVVAWLFSVLVYQLLEGHSLLWIGASVAGGATLVAAFFWGGRRWAT